MGKAKFIYSFLVFYSVYVLGVGGFTLIAALQDDSRQNTLLYMLTALCLTKGMFFFRPARTIPEIRRIAAQSGAGIFRFFFAILIFAPLVVMIAMPGVLFWIAIFAAVSFFWVFVFPGTVFAGIKSVADNTMTRYELNDLFVRVMRGNRTLRVISTLNMLVFITFLLAGFFTHKTLPTPVWEAASIWGALVIAATNLGIMFYPYILCLPREARTATFPGWAVFAVLTFVGLVPLYTMTLRNGAANLLASISGYEKVVQFEILSVHPDSYRKGCRGSLFVRTSTGPTEFCNLKRPFLRNLEGRQYVIANGQQTALGLVVSSLEIEPVGVTD